MSHLLLMGSKVPRLSQARSERAKGKYDEEERADPEGHQRPIAKELVFLGTGFLPVPAFPFEYTDENQGQKQGNNCCGDQAARS